jgi:ribosomal protein S18 acetylase RimI-like enzyme
MAAHSATHTPFLGCADEGPVAMGWLALVNRIPGPEVFVRRSAYVQSVYVKEHLRSQGIGLALMTFILDHARTLDLDYLVVHPSERAVTLYRRLGFSETTRVLELRG